MNRFWKCLTAVLRLSCFNMRERKVTPYLNDDNLGTIQNRPVLNKPKEGSVTKSLRPSVEHHSSIELFKNEYLAAYLRDGMTSEGKFKYHLRDVENAAYFNLYSKTRDVPDMIKELFDLEQDVAIKVDDRTLCLLYNMIFYDEVHGSRPTIPFPSTKSLLNYLFVECRDLFLIRLLLKVCQRNPLLLKKYDLDLRKEMNLNAMIGMRELLMLSFLIQMHENDYTCFFSIFKLTGFPTIPHLLQYYRTHPEILEMNASVKENVAYFQDYFRFLDERKEVPK